jgi:hypothetical protein
MVLVLSGLGIAGYLLFNLKHLEALQVKRGKPEEILIYVLRIYWEQPTLLTPILD